jgi:DNA polymerase-3 subunit epsilon
MNTLFFYDTETTGLPLYSEPSTDPRQPYITQIAAELCDEATGETLAAMNFLIQPAGWTIPDDIATLTGITTEKAQSFGVPIKDAMHMLFDMWSHNTVRVAHNQPFDARIVRIAMLRDLKSDETFAEQWKAAPAFCTQSKSTKIVNAAREPGCKLKTANLREAYKHFTGLELINAHNAAADVAACKAVYYGIQKHNSGVIA